MSKHAGNSEQFFSGKATAQRLLISAKLLRHIQLQTGRGRGRSEAPVASSRIAYILPIVNVRAPKKFACPYGAATATAAPAPAPCLVGVLAFPEWQTGTVCGTCWRRGTGMARQEPSVDETWDCTCDHTRENVCDWSTCTRNRSGVRPWDLNSL